MTRCGWWGLRADPSIRRRRRKAGGNGSKRYTEGWIEFADKKIARRVAESLNNTIIGGKKGNFYHDDIWNLKYLKGFKWEHLTEKLAYERRIREQKLAAQSMQDRRNAQQFVELLDKNTAYHKIQERKVRCIFAESVVLRTVVCANSILS